MSETSSTFIKVAGMLAPVLALVSVMLTVYSKDVNMLRIAEGQYISGNFDVVALADGESAATQPNIEQAVGQMCDRNCDFKQVSHLRSCKDYADGPLREPIWGPYVTKQEDADESLTHLCKTCRVNQHMSVICTVLGLIFVLSSYIWDIDSLNQPLVRFTSSTAIKGFAMLLYFCACCISVAAATQIHHIKSKVQFKYDENTETHYSTEHSPFLAMMWANSVCTLVIFVMLALSSFNKFKFVTKGDLGAAMM